MAKVVSAKNRKTRRGLKIFLSGILLAAAGAVLYGIPPSLLDISRIIQSAVSKIPSNSAGLEPAASVLRGSVYDQRFNELAVSYRLYTLNIRPAEVADHKAVAESLSEVISRPAREIEGSMKSSRQTRPWHCRGLCAVQLKPGFIHPTLLPRMCWASWATVQVWPGLKGVMMRFWALAQCGPAIFPILTSKVMTAWGPNRLI